MVNSKEIKVSVIIPVYNTEKYLRQCLDSVVRQTLREIEIICVDDGSTDTSGQILEEYAARDQRFRILHQKNKYAGAARNAGLEKASGKYVVFWDSDDLFDKTVLMKLYKKCEADGAEIGVCGGKRLDDETGRIYATGAYLVKKMLPSKRPFSKKEIPQYIFNFTTNVPWNKMFLREFVLKHQLEFQTLRQANDVYFSMMALFLAERITVVRGPLVIYRVENQSSLTGQASDTRYCTMEAYRAVFRKLEEYPEFTVQVRRSFANKALDIILYSLKVQRNIRAYEDLFRLYKEEALEEFGIIGHEKGYIYNEQYYCDLQQMLQWDYQQFLLYQFRSSERRYQMINASWFARLFRLMERIRKKCK